MPLLAYDKWSNFQGVIEKARTAAATTGAPVDHHFADAGNMVPIGSGAERERSDWYLSRYACYLIAMNADPSKQQVGHAMTYFAVQTRRQEIQQKALVDGERVRLRMRVADNNRRLAGAAKNAGVQRYPIFQDAGYQGLYGMSLANVKTKKGIDHKDDLLDHAGRLELAANDFRITLTEERLNRDNVHSEAVAVKTHRDVGSEVRQTMVRDKNIRPEDLPVEPSIKPAVLKHRRLLKAKKELK